MFMAPVSEVLFKTKVAFVALMLRLPVITSPATSTLSPVSILATASSMYFFGAASRSACGRRASHGATGLLHVVRQILGVAGVARRQMPLRKRKRTRWNRCQRRVQLAVMGNDVIHGVLRAGVEISHCNQRNRRAGRATDRDLAIGGVDGDLAGFQLRHRIGGNVAAAVAIVRSHVTLMVS